MKCTDLIFIIAAVVMLSASVSAAGVNALSISKDKIPSLGADTIQMFKYGSDAMLCINCDKDVTPTKKVSCRDKTCILYTGFKQMPKEALAEFPEEEGAYSILTADEYKPGKSPFRQKVDDDLIIVSADNVLGIGKDERIKYGASEYYTWPDKHVLYVTGADVMLDQGSIEMIAGKNRDIETVWIDSIGVPLRAGDEIVFNYENGKYAYSQPVLAIGPASPEPKEWLKNLPDELTKEGKPEIMLCRQKFANFFSGSKFMLSRFGGDCLVKAYTLNTERFDKKEHDYKCGSLAYSAVGGNLKSIGCSGGKIYCNEKKDGKSFSLCNGDIQSFSITQGKYLFSIEKGSGLFSINGDGKDIAFNANALKVSHASPAGRYPGDIILAEDNAIINFASGRNVIEANGAGLKVIRQVVGGLNYAYIFETAGKEFVMELGSNPRSGAIAAIYPKGYVPSDKERAEISSNKDDRILLFGVSECGEKMSLNEADTGKIRVCSKASGDPKIKSSSRSVIDLKKGADVCNMISEKCFGKPIASASMQEKAKVQEQIDKIQGLNPGKVAEQCVMGKDAEIELPWAEQVTYMKEGSEGKVTITPLPAECPAWGYGKFASAGQDIDLDAPLSQDSCEEDCSDMKKRNGCLELAKYKREEKCSDVCWYYGAGKNKGRCVSAMRDDVCATDCGRAFKWHCDSLSEDKKAFGCSELCMWNGGACRAVKAADLCTSSCPEIDNILGCAWMRDMKAGQSCDNTCAWDIKKKCQADIQQRGML